MLTTWRVASAAESETRESGTLETIPSDDAVTATSAAATRYAYVKLVTAPVPRSLAKRRQTTKNACSTIGSAAARASSASLAPTASGRNAPQWARSIERCEWHGERDGGVQERSPGARDDPVLADPPEDQPEAEHAAERVAGRRRAVAVVGGERAGGERCEEMGDGGGDEEDERVGRRLARARRQSARELPGRPVVREHAERERRHGDRRDGERVGREHGAERAFVAGARERRQHGDTDRTRGQHDHEEDAVGGEEPVRLGAAAELACDHDADGGRETGDDGQRERRQQAA